MSLLFCSFFSVPASVETKLSITKGAMVKFRNLNLKHWLFENSHMVWEVWRKYYLSMNL